MRLVLISGCCSLLLLTGGCAVSDRVFLRKNAGLDICRSANLDRLFNARETNDAESYRIELQPQCAADFLSIAQVSSQGEGRVMLPRQGKCFYQFNHHSVVLSESNSKQAYEVRVWH